MRVLYIHQHFSTPEGTTGVRSYKMSRKLLERGHSVTMVCGSYDRSVTGLSGPFVRGKRKGRVNGIDIIELDLAYSNNQGFLTRSAVFLRFATLASSVALTEEYDVIVATSTPLTVGIPAILGRILRRKALVFEVRDLWPELPRAMGVITNPVILLLLRVLEWLVYRASHRLIGLSRGMVSGIVSRGVDAARVKLIPNGCDLDLFDDEANRPLRPEMLRDDDFVAIYAGSHGIANGLQVLVEAAKELEARGDDRVRVLLVGDGSEKTSLKQAVEAHGLRNRVIFLDPVGKRELASLLKGADLGIQCLNNVEAFYDGTSPNKFFDYIASGLPVLVNYPGWIAELVEANNCGWAVAPDEPARIADALQEAASSPAIAAERGKAALELGRREFDREMLSEEFTQWVTDCESG